MNLYWKIHKNIKHLTCKNELPRNAKSTKEVLKVINELNENHTPLPDTARLVLPDVTNMYANVDTEEGLSDYGSKLKW